MIKLLDTPTQRPLTSLIMPMTRWLEQTRRDREYNASLIDIYRGNIARYVDNKLIEINGKEGAIQSIAVKVVVNPLRRLIDKLSKVYTDGVVRTTENTVNQEIIDYYSRELNLDAVMQDVNEYYNLNKYCALEPFLLNGKPSLRVLTSDECIPFSDNEFLPSIPTVIIKPMGVAYEYKGFNFNYDSGESYRNVDIYWAYSTTEIIIFDSDGSLRDDLMFQYGLIQQVIDGEGEDQFVVMGNPYGIIPYLFINESNKNIIPIPDSDLYPMAIDPSVQYTNLNYGLLYQSYGMLTAIDIDESTLKGAKISPRQILNLKSDADSRDGGGRGSLEVIHPKVDVAGAIQSIESKWQFFLTSRGLNPSNVSGRVSTQEFSSGVDRLIAEADATNLYRQQITTFKNVENVFWQLMSVVHNYWVSNNELTDESRGLTDDISVQTSFTVAQPNYDEQTLIDLEASKVSNGFTSRRRALRRIWPDLNEEELDQLMEEIMMEERRTSIGGSFNMVQAMANARPLDIQEEQDEEEES